MYNKVIFAVVLMQETWLEKNNVSASKGKIDRSDYSETKLSTFKDLS